MSASCAPVVVFAYRRPRHLEKVLKALMGQPEAGETQLILFLDGARGSSDRSDVAAVKKVAEEAKGFRDVRICTAEKNKGLARSITEGVGTICREHGEAIVLEDDIVPLPGFLSFMNEALGKYQDDRNVMQISGYSYPIPNKPLGHGFLPLTSCWGWATWQRAWKEYHWDCEEAQKDLQDLDFVQRFDLGGAYPYSQLLEDVVRGKSDSWGVIWYWNVFRRNGVSLFPLNSLVENIGWDGTGEHAESQEFLGIIAKENRGVMPKWPQDLKISQEHLQEVCELIRCGQEKKKKRGILAKLGKRLGLKLGWIP